MSSERLASSPRLFQFTSPTETMSDKKRRRMPKIHVEREKREDGADVNPIKKVHAGDAHDLLTSHISKPVRCILPEIGNGQLMRQHKGNTMRGGGGRVVPSQLPQLQVKPVAQQQAKILSKRSSIPSLRLDSQQDRNGSEEQKLPIAPTVVLQDFGNKEHSQPRRDRPEPLSLPPIENSFGDARSARLKPEAIALGSTTGLGSLCRLPEIGRAPAKRSAPQSGTPRRAPSALPPVSGGTGGVVKILRLPPIEGKKRAEPLTMDRKKKMYNF